MPAGEPLAPLHPGVYEEDDEQADGEKTKPPFKTLRDLEHREAGLLI